MVSKLKAIIGNLNQSENSYYWTVNKSFIDKSHANKVPISIVVHGMQRYI